MMKKNFIRRLKAAIVGAAMIATTFAAPAMSSLTTVFAEAKEIKSLPHTFIADGVNDGDRQGNVNLSKDLQSAKALKFNFTTTSKTNATVAIYGFGTTENIDNNKYWTAIDKSVGEFKTGGQSSFSYSVDVPAAIQGKINKVGVGIWYPEDNSEWTLKSVEAVGKADNPTLPSTAAELVSSGTSKIEDNHDGTATISATLSAKYAETNDKGDRITEFDFPLTLRADKLYAPYLDEDGNVLPEYKESEGGPINSKKFKFRKFGIDNLNSTDIRLQSFQFTIKSDDYTMSEIQYGGGINVNQGSVADTEILKKNPDGSPKDGYWYNDQGEEDIDAYEFGVKVNGAYTVTEAGGYAKVTWNVPEDVQPYVDLKGSDNAVSFQYWWGTDATKEGEGDSGLFEIPEIHLVNCIATYTRTMTVPYNKTITKTPNSKLTLGETTNNAEYSLADLDLGKRDKISAIRFTFNSASELAQFEGGVGISVDGTKISDKAEGVVEGWYNSQNITVINTNGKFEVMWIVPESIRNGIYTGDDGKVQIGYYYGDKDGVKVSDITIPKVEYFVYESHEDDLKLTDKSGNLIGDEVITLQVGDTYDIISNVPGTEFESERPTVATVDSNGTVEALAAGVTNITVTTPDGQTATVTIKVVEDVEPTTTAPVTTTPAPTTTTKPVTTPATTTVDPDTVIDWNNVLYGDVNVDGRVSLADVIKISKYLISNTNYPLKNATAYENADTVYDGDINSSDSIILSEYNLKNKTIDDLGPADKSKVTRVPYYDPKKS